MQHLLMYLQPLLLVCLLLLQQQHQHASVSGYSLPAVGSILPCYSSTDVDKALQYLHTQHPDETDMLVVGLVSSSFQFDSYIVLYLGWVIDIFHWMPGFKHTYFIIYQ